MALKQWFWKELQHYQESKEHRSGTQTGLPHSSQSLSSWSQLWPHISCPNFFFFIVFSTNSDGFEFQLLKLNMITTYLPKTEKWSIVHPFLDFYGCGTVTRLHYCISALSGARHPTALKLSNQQRAQLTKFSVGFTNGQTVVLWWIIYLVYLNAQASGNRYQVNNLFSSSPMD